MNPFYIEPADIASSHATALNGIMQGFNTYQDRKKEDALKDEEEAKKEAEAQAKTEKDAKAQQIVETGNREELSKFMIVNPEYKGLDKIFERAEEDRARQSFRDVVQNGTPDEVQQMKLKHPKITKEFNEQVTFENDQSKANYIQTLVRTLQNPEDVDNLVKGRMAFLKNMGMDEDKYGHTAALPEEFKKNKEESILKTERALSFLMDPAKYKQLKDSGVIQDREPKDKNNDPNSLKEFNAWKAMKRGPEKDAYGRKAGFVEDGKDGEEKDLITIGTTAFKRNDKGDLELYPGFAEGTQEIYDIKNPKDDYVPLSEESINDSAALYLVTNKMTSLGRSKEALNDKRKIINERTRLMNDLNLTPGQVNMLQAKGKGLSQSLAAQEKSIGSLRSYVDNIDGQIKRVEELAAKMGDTGARIFNKPKRWLIKKTKGSGDYNNIRSYILELANEISKVSSDSTQSIAGLSVDQVNHWLDVLDQDLPMTELMKVAKEISHQAGIRFKSKTDARDVTANELSTLAESVKNGTVNLNSNRDITEQEQSVFDNTEPGQTYMYRGKQYTKGGANNGN